MRVNCSSFSSFVKKIQYCQKEEYLMKRILRKLDKKGDDDATMGTDN